MADWARPARGALQGGQCRFCTPSKALNLHLHQPAATSLQSWWQSQCFQTNSWCANSCTLTNVCIFFLTVQFTYKLGPKPQIVLASWADHARWEDVAHTARSAQIPRLSLDCSNFDILILESIHHISPSIKWKHGHASVKEVQHGFGDKGQCWPAQDQVSISIMILIYNRYNK